ncbi:hypothetical protein BL253_37255 [Pseudofrankia asymbiotica]|uniref:2Fe-2S ferredoxin-type domain-containing protein n=3 Tax=Pseudofrankia asymbiotica TaxID=1834516 RepID=A0A1V2HZ49_9ACTN|nr:hypothetical protein BL253_37255 [Pseudofrankia asymbiotica]
MIAAAEDANAAWRLFYGGRQRVSMAFLPELDRYGAKVSTRPQDEVGLLDLATILVSPRPDTLIYCCGPEPLLAAVEAHCVTWPSGALHLERFAPKPTEKPVLDTNFEVVLQRSNVALTVAPDDTIFDVVADAGIDVLGSCFEGTCGTCETTVLNGVPDHRDSVLTKQQQESNSTMMICVSRSRTPRLVLDL